MRVVLLILLIALAPLRGMANELMATRMATTLAMSVSAPAAAGDNHARQPPLRRDGASPPPQLRSLCLSPQWLTFDGCENCSLCQMCASTALPAEFRLALSGVRPAHAGADPHRPLCQRPVGFGPKTTHFLIPRPEVGL